jgi:hypothetical protein
MTPKHIKSFRDEEWKDLSIDNLSERSKYKISNYGRIVSYYYSKEGVLLKLGNVLGYRSLSIRDKDGKQLYLYVHRLVAEHFLDKPKDDQNIVLHLDSNRHNNYYRNLKWANQSEQYHYNLKVNPNAKRLQPKGDRAWSKLTESEVRVIKRKLKDPNRKTKMKVLARQFGISEMQLSRIKSGENWGNVKVD